MIPSTPIRRPQSAPPEVAPQDNAKGWMNPELKTATTSVVFHRIGSGGPSPSRF